jgi:hypothetical protein
MSEEPKAKGTKDIINSGKESGMTAAKFKQLLGE